MGLTDFYEHGIARGIVRYARGRPDWDLYGYGWMFQSIGSLDRWDGDGLVARIESGRDADRLAGRRLPVVDVAGAWRRKGFRQVCNNDAATGALACRHLQAIGFRLFAFCGVADVGWSRLRREGFLAVLGGKSIPVFEAPLPWWERLHHSERLEAWIRALPHPVAVFACNDTAGLKVAAACRDAGLSVPRDVAILGVDNEDILCELCVPPLSSIMLDCEQIGFRAAELLGRMLEESGGDPADPQLIAPREVVDRSSTHLFPSADPLVEEAVALIRSLAGEPVNVAGLLQKIPASRRSLEIRFRRSLGRSMHDEIVRVRIERARELLRTTTLTVAAVAASSGFGNPQRFHEVFRIAAGMTPGAYRKSHQR
jgi:LacI family transcriptional regulator